MHVLYTEWSLATSFTQLMESVRSAEDLAEPYIILSYFFSSKQTKKLTCSAKTKSSLVLFSSSSRGTSFPSSASPTTDFFFKGSETLDFFFKGSGLESSNVSWLGAAFDKHKTEAANLITSLPVTPFNYGNTGCGVFKWGIQS